MFYCCVYTDYWCKHIWSKLTCKTTQKSTPEILSLLFHIFFLLVKTCHIHYPQCNLPANSWVGDSVLATGIRQRWGTGYKLTQSCGLQTQLTPTQVTSLEAIYRISHSSFLSHKMLRTTTCVVKLPNICKQTLMCKVFLSQKALGIDCVVCKVLYK